MTMRSWLAARTLNERLAAVALVLAVVALPATPYRGGRAAVDARQLTLDIAAGHGRVAPIELADWIIQGRGDYRLIDLRTEAEFGRAHIPTAENVPVERLTDAAIARSEKVVLYAATDMVAAQAWLILRSQGYLGVQALEGSLARWNDEVVSPVLQDESLPDARTANARLTAVSAFFGGKPRIGGQAILAEVTPIGQSTPPVAAPTATAKPAVAKKKEGC